MSTDIQIFTNQEFNKEIRAIEINGDPWFVGKDIAEALGYVRPSDAVRDNVPDKYKLVRQITESGQRRNMVLINEAGLYKLVMRSRLPNAERFSDWACEEVFPQLRKTGSYSIVNQPPMDYLEALKQLVAKEEAYRAEKARADENQEVKELYDTSVAQNNYWIPMKAVADILDCVGVGRTNLYRFLRDEGVLTSKNEPMRQYQENGFMKTSYYSDWLGQYVCVVSFKGLKFIFKKLKNANKIPRSTTFDDWVALCKDMVVKDDESGSILTD